MFSEFAELHVVRDMDVFREIRLRWIACLTEIGGGINSLIHCVHVVHPHVLRFVVVIVFFPVFVVNGDYETAYCRSNVALFCQRKALDGFRVAFLFQGKAHHCPRDALFLTRKARHGPREAKLAPKLKHYILVRTWPRT